jgi:hypothetical protein
MSNGNTKVTKEKEPNNSAAGNCAGAPSLHAGLPWRAVPVHDRSAAMHDSRFQSPLWPVSLVAVIGLLVPLALLICPFTAPVTTPVLRVLADREFNPPHSLRSRILSLGFQPIEFVLDLGPVAQLASRDTRHWVYSITSRPDE